VAALSRTFLAFALPPNADTLCGHIMPQRNTILIVDSRPAEVEALATLLTRDCDVTVVADPAAAWRHLMAQRPDLVIIDVDCGHQADTLGYQLVRRMRGERGTATVPVVLLSAQLDPQVEGLGLQLGAVDVLGKPLQVDIARLRVANHLERGRLRAALTRSLRAGGLALWEGVPGGCRITDGAYELLGVDDTRLAVQGLGWSRLVHTDDLAALAAALRSAGAPDLALQADAVEPAGTGRAALAADPVADRVADPAADRAGQRGSTTLAVDLRMRRHDGHWIWVALQGRVFGTAAAGARVGAHPDEPRQAQLAGTLVDISERKQLEASLREREAGLSALMTSLHDLVITLDAWGRVVTCHLPDDFELDLPPGPAIGRHVDQLLPASVTALLHGALLDLAQHGRRRSFECSWKPRAAGLAGAAADGVVCHGLASLSMLQAPAERLATAFGDLWDDNGAEAPALRRPTGRVSQRGEAPGVPALLVLRDVTAHKIEEEVIRHLAYFDPLTALPNRRLLHDRLRQAQASSQRRQRHGALIFIDLDHFKQVNDQFGHQAGDQLLIELARRLQVSVRACDTVARLAGDEFVVVLADLDPAFEVAQQQLGQIASKMLARLARSYDIGGRRHRCTASLGATLFMGLAQPMERLMSVADGAMYRAKAAGRNAVTISDELA
jgi:diguanylate cyclase (GGDEF)-like protein